jgi:hypothetical protein
LSHLPPLQGEDFTDFFLPAHVMGKRHAPKTRSFRRHLAVFCQLVGWIKGQHDAASPEESNIIFAG